jgi:hypothetical protein
LLHRASIGSAEEWEHGRSVNTHGTAKVFWTDTAGRHPSSAGPRATPSGKTCYGDAMDRDTLERHLRQAEARITQNEHLLARQRELVARFAQDRPHTAKARAFLAQLEKMLQMHVADRDQIRQEPGM